MRVLFFTIVASVLCSTQSYSQQKAKPEETEVWSPEPPKVTPRKNYSAPPPADAIILFDGKNLQQWVSNADPSVPAQWKVANGILTVDKQKGNIETKAHFLDYQLHLEWRIPKNITGSGQLRGNSGLFLSSVGVGDPGYEIQILDSYTNKTYVNGMAGSIYKQFPPIVNATLPAGEWQVYDIAWKAPRFNADGSLASPAFVTVFLNGILVQNNVALKGPTQYIGDPSYNIPHGATPIKLQAHGDKSEPVSFRNIWLRKL